MCDVLLPTGVNPTAGKYIYPISHHYLPSSRADIMESGRLNLPEPSRPHRPVMGMFYLYFLLLSSNMQYLS
jgi:hypothetical protein